MVLHAQEYLIQACSLTYNYLYAIGILKEVQW